MNYTGKTFLLPSGGKIPAVGLGTWQSPKGEVRNAVKVAIQAGYRHIDCAAIYKNESEVGEGIIDSGIPRSELWLTSKLWNNAHKPDQVEPALNDSLQKLGTDYLDLYIIHWPVAFSVDPSKANGYKPEIDWELTRDPMQTWRVLESLVKKGKLRNIGISNFTAEKAQKLYDQVLPLPLPSYHSPTDSLGPKASIKPAVNQVELSLQCPQPDLLAWAKKTGVLLQAYSPLGSTGATHRDDPVVKEIAATHKVDPANILISWQVQRGAVVLPKSVTESRIIANFKDVELTKAEVEKLEKRSMELPFVRAVDPSEAWGVTIYESGEAKPKEKSKL
ncbi:hypothetical protein P7C70_g4511, partial [Phenoliferia sp. Uapishka_3]